MAFFLILSLSQCGSPTVSDWKTLVPEQATIIYKSKGQNVAEFVRSDAVQFLGRMGVNSLKNLSDALTLTYLPNKLLSAAMVPIDADHWEMLMIIESTEELAETLFAKNKAENGTEGYLFNDFKIYRTVLNRQEYFVCSTGSFTLISRSSLAVEQALASKSTAQLKSDTETETAWVFNFNKLGDIVRQNLQVKYRSLTREVFSSLGNAAFNYEKTDSLNRLSSKIPRVQSSTNPLDQAIGYENKAFVLGEYIPSNAAHFSIFRNTPLSTQIQYEQAEGRKLSILDSALVENDILRSNMIEALDIEFGVVSFAESGYLEQGEYLWLRHLKDPQAFYKMLLRLEEGGLIQAEDDLFYVHSYFLAQLLSSGMATSDRFFLSVNYQAAVMAERIGLCKSVSADRSRRRVFTYDVSWKNVREAIPESFSSLHIARSKELNLYLQRFLRAGNYLSPIFEEFDRLMAFTSVEMIEDQSFIHLQADLFRTVSSYIPYEENWLFPLFNEQLSGSIAFDDLVGSSRPELVFSTDKGKVYVIASDGTLIREMQTNEGDTPTQGPIINDWYGNGLKTVLLPAGNKIYGWDNQGNPLPRFPIELTEQITAPILVQDLRQNGSPEIVVATADRKLHILDNRGEALRGWPVLLNSIASHAAVFKNWRDLPSVFISAQNVLHAYLLDGSERPSYPLFLNSDISTPVLFEEDHLIVGDQSGALNAIGLDAYFNGSYFTNDTDILNQKVDSLVINRVEFGGTAIVGELKSSNVAVYQPSDSLVISEKRILFQSFSGQIYMMNEKAEIAQRFELGEFVAETQSPIVLSLYPSSKSLKDHSHLLTLSSYGRLQGWDLRTGRRLISLPSSSLQYPLLIDLNNDGIIELIGNASEGVRSWNLME